MLYILFQPHTSIIHQSHSSAILHLYTTLQFHIPTNPSAAQPTIPSAQQLHHQTTPPNTLPQLNNNTFQNTAASQPHPHTTHAAPNKTNRGLKVAANTAMVGIIYFNAFAGRSGEWQTMPKECMLLLVYMLPPAARRLPPIISFQLLSMNNIISSALPAACRLPPTTRHQRLLQF